MTNPPPAPTTIGTTSSSTTKPKSIGESLTAQLGALLSKALNDVTVLEVRTFTSSSDAPSNDPLGENARLRAFSRISFDGDTQQCVPVLANGEPDDTLWKLHCEAVDQARKDRAASVEAVMAVIKGISGR